MKFNLFTTLCLALSVSLVSCSREDVEDGVQGLKNALENGRHKEGNSPNNSANEVKLKIDISDTEADLTQVFIKVPELTREVLQNNAIVFHLEDIDNQDYLSVPGRMIEIDDRRYDFLARPGEITISINDLDGFSNLGWIYNSWDFLYITIIEIVPNALSRKS
ncbi:MAG: hypothetical protein AAFY00_02340 [Bacteroidota bacterium]